MNQESNYKRHVVLLIVISTVIRLLFAGLAELNNDEVYYWGYATHLQWNYFDHPPMVALFIRLFTFNLALPFEVFIRLGAVLSAAYCTWVIYKTGYLIRNPYTGWIAACLYTASFYGSVIAGVLILPDSPQLAFWLTSVYMMLSVIRGMDTGKNINMTLLNTGIFTGLCILSKVHGVFLWFGFLSYIMLYKRKLLANPYLYLSILVTLVMMIPASIWLIENNFSTYTYHSGRISSAIYFHRDSFLREVAGSILYNNPVVFCLVVAGIVYSISTKSQVPAAYRQLLLWTGLPLIIAVLVLSLFNDTLPHWSGPGYITLLPLAAAYIASRTGRKVLRVVPASVMSALIVSGAALLACLIIINYWPAALGKKQLPGYGAQDATLDMSGWRQLQQGFAAFVETDNKNKEDTPECIFSDYWFPAAHIAFYIAKPLGMDVKAVGTLSAIHHFAWLNTRLTPLKTGADAYYITVSNFYHPPSADLLKHFSGVLKPVCIPQYRSGALVRYMFVYRLVQYKGTLPANGLL